MNPHNFNKLCLYDSVGWANFDTTAAIGALLGIDCIDFLALRNGIIFTFIDTGTTGDAFFRYFMRHFSLLITEFKTVTKIG